jgi:hypothetical protein
LPYIGSFFKKGALRIANDSAVNKRTVAVSAAKMMLSGKERGQILSAGYIPAADLNA